MLVLQQVHVHNFASFADLKIRFSELTVLVGPNGAGKSNLLKLLRFLGETARLDLGPAVSSFGGFDQILFQGDRKDNRIKIELSANLTKYASEAAPDEYSITFWAPLTRHARANTSFLAREESFLFKRTRGRGRRITLSGRDVSIEQPGGRSTRAVEVQESSAGLSILRRLSKSVDASQVEELAELFESLRVFDVDVDVARRPSPTTQTEALSSDASNLAAYLSYLASEHQDIFEQIGDDLKQALPGLNRLEVRSIGGATEGRVVLLHEHGLRRPTPLALASYGTVRALALFTMLSDPAPPKLTCIEEIDHGLHPYALDRLVDRLRAAAQRTQLIVATHSPALVNRLDVSELAVFERDSETGATRRPKLSDSEIRAIAQESDYRLGELWFSGLLGGVPD